MTNKKSFFKHSKGGAGTGSVIYCLGLIGAGVYFIQNANTFTEGILGVLKAIVWPAILVYKALEALL